MRVRPGPELAKTEREVAAWARFQGLVEQVAAVNEAICAVRPRGWRRGSCFPRLAGGKRGLASQARAGLEAGVRAEATAEITRLTCLLAGQVAGQVSAGDSGGLEVV